MKYKYKLGQSFFRIIKSIPISHLLPGWRSASPLYSKVNVDFSVNQRQMGSLVNFLSCFPFFSLFFSSPALWLEKKCNSESPFSCFLLCSLKGSVGKNAEPLTINSKALQPNPVKSGLRPGEGGKEGVCAELLPHSSKRIQISSKVYSHWMCRYRSCDWLQDVGPCTGSWGNWECSYWDPFQHCRKAGGLQEELCC